MAGPMAMASAFMVPYRPMPAPICRIGSSSDIRVAKQTEQQAKPTPLTIRAAISDAVFPANAYHTLDTKYREAPMPTSSLLLARSARLPAIGRQNRDTTFIMPAIMPIIAPAAPRLSENPAINCVASILLAMKQKVATITNATSRVINRSEGFFISRSAALLFTA